MNPKSRYSPRKIGTIVDIIHIVVGIAVTIMAGFAISTPERFMYLFPLIFALAAVLSGVSGWYSLVTYQRNTRRKISGIAELVLTVLLLALFIVSAISIWGNN